jgi:hypothetical protein
MSIYKKLQGNFFAHINYMADNSPIMITCYLVLIGRERISNTLNGQI